MIMRGSMALNGLSNSVPSLDEDHSGRGAGGGELARKAPVRKGCSLRLQLEKGMRV